MMRLLISECKKIGKNKINLVLILLMTLGMSYFTYDEYHNQTTLPTYPDNTPLTFKTLDGSPLTSVHELNAYAKNMLEKYEDMDMTPETWERFKNDYHTQYDRLTQKVDTARMKKIYGDDYKRIPRPGIVKNAKAIYEIADTSLFEYEMNGNPIYQYDEETDTAILPVFYEKQAELHTLNYIYRNNPQASYIRAMMNQGNPYITDEVATFEDMPLYYFTHKELLHENIMTQTSMVETDTNSTASKAVNTTIKNLVDKETFTFGSTKEMERFKYVLTKFTFISLLLIAILLANSFSIESRTGVDQIILPTKTGMVKIAIAKMIAGLSIALFTILLQLVCILGISYLSIDMSGWSLSITSSSSLATYTYLEYFLAKMQIVFLACIAIAMVTMVLSSLIKNQFFTVVIVILFIMMPYFLRDGIPLWIVRLLPSSFMDGEYLSTDMLYGSQYLLLGNTVYQWKNIATIFWLVTGAIFTFIMLMSAKKQTISNH